VDALKMISLWKNKSMGIVGWLILAIEL